jgi:putative transposase
MTDGITNLGTESGEDPLLAVIRPAVREAIETALEAELQRQLGAARYARIDARSGYRHGHRERALGTSVGALTIQVPRARVDEREWHSTQLPRYRRRLRSLDELALRVYVSGTNQRKVAAAVRPLLRGVGMSKSTVSRLAQQLATARDTWRRRPLHDDALVYLFLDGFVVPVRRDGRVVRQPLLVAVGVRATGEKVLLALQLASGESAAAWRQLLEDLEQRGLRPPRLCVMDGGLGLRAALTAIWPGVAVQRCTVHKLRNLLAHAPEHAQAAVKADFHRIVYAEDAATAQRAYRQFVQRWQRRCASVARSLEEGGPELLTVFQFPCAQWRALRSTNVIERIHEELRRRIKTQGAWGDEEAIVSLLHGLFAGGILRLRRLDGWTTIAPLPVDVAA